MRKQQNIENGEQQNIENGERQNIAKHVCISKDIAIVGPLNRDIFSFILDIIWRIAFRIEI